MEDLSRSDVQLDGMRWV